MTRTDLFSALPDSEADRAGFVLAVADLRERWATEADAGPWCPAYIYRAVQQVATGRDLECPKHEWGAKGCKTWGAHDGRYVAAEANPVHALAEVKLWRDVVASTHDLHPLLLAAVEAAQAYLTGVSR